MGLGQTAEGSVPVPSFKLGDRWIWAHTSALIQTWHLTFDGCLPLPVPHFCYIHWDNCVYFKGFSIPLRRVNDLDSDCLKFIKTATTGF